MGKPDRATRLTERNKALHADGDCAHCRPHKGENSRKKPRNDRYKDKNKT